MPVPFVALAVAGAGLYGGYRGIRGGIENRRYWSDYQRKTGVVAKYPVRSGYSYDYSRVAYSGVAVSGLYSPRSTYGFYRHYDPAVR